MNRKERRQAQKDLKMGEKISARPMNIMAPLDMQAMIRKYPEIKFALDRWESEMKLKVAKETLSIIEMEKERASNETMGLLLSTFAIVLKELHDIEPAQVNKILGQIMEQLDLCASELVTTDEIVSLCQSYGIDISNVDEIMDRIGEKILKKIKLFELLDAGVVEIEELANKANISAREASAFRWEYNTKKYGVVDMTKKEQVFKYLEQGLRKEEIMKNALITSASYDQYKYLWKRENKTVTPDDLADALFADGFSDKKNNAQRVCESSSGQLQGENKKVSTESINSTIERAEKNNQSQEKIEEVNSVEEKKVFVPTSKKKELKVRRTVEVEGEFDTYKIENNVVEFGGKALTKDQFTELIEELQIVAEQF